MNIRPWLIAIATASASAVLLFPQWARPLHCLVAFLALAALKSPTTGASHD